MRRAVLAVIAAAMIVGAGATPAWASAEFFAAQALEARTTEEARHAALTSGVPAEIGAVTRFEYDDRGLPVTEINPLGITILSTEYDALGRPVRATNGNGEVTTTTYPLHFSGHHLHVRRSRPGHPVAPPHAGAPRSPRIEGVLGRPAHGPARGCPH